MYESELSQGSWSGLLPVLLPRRPARWWCLSPWKDPWVFHHVRSCKATVCSPGLWSARSQGSVWDGFSGSYRKSGERKQDGFLFLQWTSPGVFMLGRSVRGCFMSSCVCLFWLELDLKPAVLFRDKGKRKENSPSPARRLPLKQIRLRQIEAEEQRWRKWFQNKTTIFFSKNKIRDAFQQLQVMSADGCPETTKLCFLFQICFVFYKGDV